MTEHNDNTADLRLIDAGPKGDAYQMRFTANVDVVRRMVEAHRELLDHYDAENYLVMEFGEGGYEVTIQRKGDRITPLDKIAMLEDELKEKDERIAQLEHRLSAIMQEKEIT